MREGPLQTIPSGFLHGNFQVHSISHSLHLSHHRPPFRPFPALPSSSQRAAARTGIPGRCTASASTSSSDVSLSKRLARHGCSRGVQWRRNMSGTHMAVAQKKRYHNGTLVSGNMDQHLRNPSCIILSHTHVTEAKYPVNLSCFLQVLGGFEPGRTLCCQGGCCMVLLSTTCDGLLVVHDRPWVLEVLVLRCGLAVWMNNPRLNK